MYRQVTLTLPDAIYDQIEQLALTTHRQVADVLADTIVQTLPKLHTNPARSAMQKESAAYQAMLETLLTEYEGEFVAVYGGRVVDHNADESLLVERIEDRYPDQVVLIKRVRPETQETLFFRSPRIV